MNKFKLFTGNCYLIISVCKNLKKLQVFIFTHLRVKNELCCRDVHTEEVRKSYTSHAYSKTKKYV